MTFTQTVFLAVIAAAGVLVLALYPGGAKIRGSLGAFGAAALLSLILLFTPPYPFAGPKGGFAMGVTTLDPKLYERKGSEYLTPTVELRYPINSTGSTANTGGKFPTIFYFSGWPGTDVDGVHLTRELVSHGFIVATVHYSLDHPGLSSKQLEERRADIGHGLDFTSEEAYHETVAFSDQRARNRAQDASAILDALIHMNANEGRKIISAPMDTDRVGIMGFSFGGSVAAQTRRQDKRFRAAIDMDGWHFAEAVSGVEPPYMYMLSDETRYPTNEEIAPSAKPEDRFAWLLIKRDFDQPIANMRRTGGILVTVSGSHHFNFSDGAFGGSLFRRLLAGVVLHRPGGLGPIDPLKAFNAVAACTTAFFEIYLKGQSPSLLDSAVSPYPEVTLQKWTAVNQQAE
jgi:dienelactone hydrolase